MVKHLVVDGYNIINKWPNLKKALNKNLTYARELLIEKLTLYSDYKDLKVTVVFDGKPNADLPYIQDDIEIIFSKGKSADSTIEELVYNATDRKELLVATDDRKHQDMVFGMGAFYISSSSLKDELDNISEDLTRAINERRKSR